MSEVYINGESCLFNSICMQGVNHAFLSHYMQGHYFDSCSIQLFLTTPISGERSQINVKTSTKSLIDKHIDLGLVSGAFELPTIALFNDTSNPYTNIAFTAYSRTNLWSTDNTLEYNANTTFINPLALSIQAADIRKNVNLPTPITFQMESNHTSGENTACVFWDKFSSNGKSCMVHS